MKYLLGTFLLVNPSNKSKFYKELKKLYQNRSFTVHVSFFALFHHLYILGCLIIFRSKKIRISILISSVFIFLQVILWFLSVSVFEIKKNIKYSFKFVKMDYMCIVNAEKIPLQDWYINWVLSNLIKCRL